MANTNRVSSVSRYLRIEKVCKGFDQDRKSGSAKSLIGLAGEIQ